MNYLADGNFSECVECSTGLRECKDYDNKEDCGVDECHFGSCYWVELTEEEGGCLKY